MPTPHPDPIAQIEDLEERVGDIAEDQIARAESLLRYASTLVRGAGNRIWDDTEGHETPGELVEVVVGMVERARDNPTGVTQETTGPFTVSWGPKAAERIYLTSGDRKIIRSLAGHGAFTVDQTATQDTGGVLGGASGGFLDDDDL